MKESTKSVYPSFFLFVALICLLLGCVEEKEDIGVQTLENQTVLTEVPSTTSKLINVSDLSTNNGKKADSTLIEKCENQDLEFNKIICYAREENDIKKCSALTTKYGGEYVSSCILEIAKAWRNNTVCDLLNRQIDKDVCNYYTAGNDKRICEEINDQKTKAECYNDIALNTLNQTLCEKSGDWIDACYTKIAEEKRDYNLCSNMTSYIAKNLCYESLATLEKDSTICELMIGEATTAGGTIKETSVCYADVAVTKKDPSICNKIEEQFYRDRCIDYLAK